MAHARSGRKGRGSKVTVVPCAVAGYAILRDQVTVDAVRALHGPMTRDSIKRYEAPAIGALNLVLEDMLEGGRSRILAPASVVSRETGGAA